MVPFFTGVAIAQNVSGELINQSWFEANGVVQRATSIMLLNVVAEVGLKIFQPFTLFDRHVLAVFAKSQVRKDELWRPPPMQLGDLNACSLRTMAMALTYGPLYPPMYALAAVAFVSDYWSTKFAIARWFRRPPLMNASMLGQLRRGLWMTVTLHIASVALVATGSVAGNDGRRALYLSVASTLWLFAEGMPWQHIRALASHDPAAQLADHQEKRFSKVRTAVDA